MSFWNKTITRIVEVHDDMLYVTDGFVLASLPGGKAIIIHGNTKHMTVNDIRTQITEVRSKLVA